MEVSFIINIIALIALAPIAAVFLASLVRSNAPDSGNPLKRVAFLVPLRKEVEESILATLRSISSLDYPRELVEVFLVIKRDDRETIENARRAAEKAGELKVSIFLSDSKEFLKAADINQALPHIWDDFDAIGVMDADVWKVDEDQLKLAVSFLEHGFGGVSPKIYTFGKGLLGVLALMESILWYDVVFRGMENMGITPPLTGKTLYIRADVLKTLGGFPETLAEDAAITARLVELGMKAGYIDSRSFTLPPKGLRWLIRQRKRWGRGMALTLKLALKSGLSRSEKLRVSFPHLLSFDLTLFLISSLLYHSVSRSPVEALPFFVIPVLVGLFTYGFTRRNSIEAGTLEIAAASLLFIPYLVLLALINLLSLLDRTQRWEKTVRR